MMSEVPVPIEAQDFSTLTGGSRSLLATLKHGQSSKSADDTSKNRFGDVFIEKVKKFLQSRGIDEFPNCGHIFQASTITTTPLSKPLTRTYFHEGPEQLVYCSDPDVRKRMEDCLKFVVPQAIP